MHDPLTVAHEIRLGNKTLLTIWHKDPETDGTDDSCGFSYPKLSGRDRKIVDEMTKWDVSHPYFSSPYLPITVIDPRYNYPQQIAGDCLALVAEAWSIMAWRRDRRRNLTIDEWWNIVHLAVSPVDNVRAILANIEEEPRERAERFFWTVMRCYLRFHRPWFRHPRWHVHHWKIQIPFWQHLKRRLFKRCAKCGNSFAWGYCPVSIRGEEKLFHYECYEVDIPFPTMIQ